MQRVRGGIGRLSDCLSGQITALGGEVRLKQNVSRILVQDNRAVGVELKNGERYTPTPSFPTWTSRRRSTTCSPTIPSRRRTSRKWTRLRTAAPSCICCSS